MAVLHQGIHLVKASGVPAQAVFHVLDRSAFVFESDNQSCAAFRRELISGVHVAGRELFLGAGEGQNSPPF